MKLSPRKSFYKTLSKQTHQECLMPLKIGFKRPFPGSTRKLRPRPRRTSSVEKTIDFVEDLSTLSQKNTTKALVVIKIVLAAKVHLLALEHLTQAIKKTI